MGNQCTRVTQSQAVYYDTVASATGSFNVYDASGNVQTIASGTYTGLASYNSCIIGIGGSASVVNYNANQSRTATTLPAGAGGTASYSAWVTTGTTQSGSYSCVGPAWEPPH